MSDRKLATVRRIDKIELIDNADAIEVAVVGGWKCVVKKGEFQSGDLVIYLEIDSFVPTELAPFLSKGKEPREFNGVKGERLRTIRLRGQISQGLILSIDSIKYTKEEDQCNVFKGQGPVTDLMNDLILTIGRKMAEEEVLRFDLTEMLGIQKWEAPMNARLAGMAGGNFPSFIRKTDQERVQNMSKELKEYIERGLTFEVTEKLEGSSMTVYFKDGEFGVASRNINLKETEGNSFWNIARKLNLEELMRTNAENIALQGELIGPWIQGNIYKLTEHQFRLFDVFDIDAQEYLSAHNRYRAATYFNVEQSPVLNEELILDFTTIDDILSYAEGESQLFKTEREGVVFKCIEDPSISFKAISNRYLANEK